VSTTSLANTDEFHVRPDIGLQTFTGRFRYWSGLLMGGRAMRRGRLRRLAAVLKAARIDYEPGMAKRAANPVRIEPSSANVFADLGLPDAAELDTKVRLAVEINRFEGGQS
jgi:hypothetical protein